MALSFGFFNAELTSSGQYDRVYAAEQFAEYFHLIVSNGVFPTPATNLQVVASDTPDMNVNVSDGYGWINGYYAKNSGPYPLAIQAASGTLNRVDAIVLRWVNSSRSMELAVKTGVAAPGPATPELQRDNDVYEIMLASVTVAAGATNIPQSSITDKRQDASVCGWVTGAVQNIDATNLFAQYDAAFQAWFDDVQSQLEGDVATNLLNRINAVDEKKVNLSDKATEDEAKAGTNNTKWMTPLRMKQLVGTAEETVQNVTSGELIRVKSKLQSVGRRGGIQLYRAGTTETNPSFYAPFSKPVLAVYPNANKLVLSHAFSATSSSNTTYCPAVSLFTYGDTYKVPTSSFKLSSSYSTASSYAQSYLVERSTFSTNGSLVFVQPRGEQPYWLIDLEYDCVANCNTNYLYTSDGFNTSSKWGFIYTYNYNTRTIYYANRGSTSFSTLSIGSGTSSSYYAINAIGVKGDYLYFIEKTSNTQYQLGRVYFPSSGAPSVTRGLQTFNSPAGGSLFISPCFFDSDYAYLTVGDRYNGSTNRIATSVLRVNLSSGSTNFSSLVFSADLYTVFNSDRSYYIGTIGGISYARVSFSEKAIMTIDKSTLAIGYTVYSIDMPSYPDTEQPSKRERIIQFSNVSNFLVGNGYSVDLDASRVSYIKIGVNIATISPYKVLTPRFISGSSSEGYSGVMFLGTSIEDTTPLGIDRDSYDTKTISGYGRYTLHSMQNADFSLTPEN